MVWLTVAAIWPPLWRLQGNNPVHFAVLAPTNEVLVFLLQQTGGMAPTGERLVDTRNDDGNPLLAACVANLRSRSRC